MSARDAEGSIRGFVKVMRDLTERKHMEEQLRARAEALQEADRRKNEFLAMLSHELRNPLAPILTSLYILKEQRAIDRSVVEQTRAMIERQVMNLKRLIDDLLDVSRMALNRIQLHLESLDLSLIAAQAAEDVQPLIQERKHELTVTTDPDPLILKGDAVRLEQVVLNLLTNAAKFTDPGGKLWLTTERDKDHAVVRVLDMGIGIAPEMIGPRIRVVRPGRSGAGSSSWRARHWAYPGPESRRVTRRYHRGQERRVRERGVSSSSGCRSPHPRRRVKPRRPPRSRFELRPSR